MGKRPRRLDVDALAARGRAVEARAQVEARRAAEDAAAAVTRSARLATTRLGWFATYLGMLAVGLGSLGLACVVVFAGGYAARASPLPAIVPFGFAAAMIALGRAAAIARSRRTYPRVLAWAAAQPFPIVGLAAALAADPTAAGVLEVRLVGSPDLDRVAQAIVGLGQRDVSATVVGDAVVVRHACLGVRDDAGPTAPSTNRPYLGFLRWLVDVFLVPLHATDPIASVTLPPDR